MSAGWAASIPIENAVSASPLRQELDIEACVADDRLWLRGTKWNDAIDRSLRKILGAERSHRLANTETARWGEVVPSGVLPHGPWMRLKDWLQPVAPPTLLSGVVTRRAGFRLVRTTTERPANLLIVDFPTWREYAASAPGIRLNRLSFAVSDDARALIRGEPLPPLEGTRYAEAKGVAAPLGWTWSPAVDAEVVRETLGLAEQDLALLTVAGVCDIIRSDEFVRATRSAVRLTEKEIGRDS